MKVNRESIYGTQASPFEKLALGPLHAKADRRGQDAPVLHVFDWPADGKLVLPDLANKPVKAFLLAGGQAVEFAAGKSPGLHQAARSRSGQACVRPRRSTSRASPGSSSQILTPDETPAQRDARMKWWREARFGMFIHWGVYSVPAGTYKGQADQRHWRVDHEPRQDSRRRIPRLRQGIQPGEIQRRRVGAPRQGGRHEIHRHHLQAPRRLCHVRLQGQRLEHRQSLAVRPRSAERTGRGLQEARAQARLLLLAGAGLEQPGRRGCRRPLGQGAGRQHGRIHRQRRRAAGAGNPQQLRQDRRALVGHADGHEQGTRRNAAAAAARCSPASSTTTGSAAATRATPKPRSSTFPPRAIPDAIGKPA